VNELTCEHALVLVSGATIDIAPDHRESQYLIALESYLGSGQKIL